MPASNQKGPTSNSWSCVYDDLTGCLKAEASSPRKKHNFFLFYQAEVISHVHAEGEASANLK